MVDTGLGQGACHGLGTEWAVLTNEVSEVESRKYLQERQAGVSRVGVHAAPLSPMKGVWPSGLRGRSPPSCGPGCSMSDVWGGQQGGIKGGQPG